MLFLHSLLSSSSQWQNLVDSDRFVIVEEGGVCGQFNGSDWCLQRDDNGEAVTEIAGY